MTKRRYGTRGGLSKGLPEDPKRCVESVSDGMNFPTFHQCKKKRGHGPKGEYCKVHNPSAVEARGKARWKRIMAPLERQQAMARDLEALRRDKERLDFLFARCCPMVNGGEMIVEVNRYGAGATGNSIVSITERADIDAVIKSEKKAGTWKVTK